MTEKDTDKRQAIMRATLELVAEQGFHGTPTSQIAKRAGVGMGTIYRYFENKDELIEEVHRELETHIKPTLFADYDTQAPIRENFQRIFSNLLWFLIDHPLEAKFMEQFYNSPYGIEKKRAQATQCDNDFAEFFNRAKERQVIKDLHTEILMALSIGPLIFIARDHLQGVFELNEETVEMILEACWDAIKR